MGGSGFCLAVPFTILSSSCPHQADSIHLIIVLARRKAEEPGAESHVPTRTLIDVETVESHAPRNRLRPYRFVCATGETLPGNVSAALPLAPLDVRPNAGKYLTAFLAPC